MLRADLEAASLGGRLSGQQVDPREVDHVVAAPASRLIGGKGRPPDSAQPRQESIATTQPLLVSRAAADDERPSQPTDRFHEGRSAGLTENVATPRVQRIQTLAWRAHT